MSRYQSQSKDARFTMRIQHFYYIYFHYSQFLDPVAIELRVLIVTTE